MNEQIVTGRLGEDVILPCSFESGPNVVIHWKNQDTNVYSYYKDSDQLENQDPRYVNRISLFRGEIHNGNLFVSWAREPTKYLALQLVKSAIYGFVVVV